VYRSISLVPAAGSVPVAAPATPIAPATGGAGPGRADEKAGGDGRALIASEPRKTRIGRVTPDRRTISVAGDRLPRTRRMFEDAAFQWNRALKKAAAPAETTTETTATTSTVRNGSRRSWSAAAWERGRGDRPPAPGAVAGGRDGVGRSFGERGTGRAGGRGTADATTGWAVGSPPGAAGGRGGAGRGGRGWCCGGEGRGGGAGAGGAGGGGAGGGEGVGVGDVRHSSRPSTLIRMPSIPTSTRSGPTQTSITGSGGLAAGAAGAATPSSPNSSPAGSALPVTGSARVAAAPT
jgi:hypothetical protein